jgi:hypothetical protein
MELRVASALPKSMSCKGQSFDAALLIITLAGCQFKKKLSAEKHIASEINDRCSAWHRSRKEICMHRTHLDIAMDITSRIKLA